MMVDKQRNLSMEKSDKAKEQVDHQRDREAIYRGIVTHLPCAVHQLVMSSNGDLRFEYIGENCLDLFGYTADQIMTDADLVFAQIPQPDFENVIQALKDSANRLTRYDVEHRFVKNPGETVWIHVFSIPRRDNSGDTIWDGIGLDITQRKRTEAELEKHRRILLEAEKLADVGSWEWDTVEDSWTMSDNWLHIHGCSHRQFTTSELLQIAHPDDRSIIQEAFRRAVENGEPYRIEHRIVRQDTGDVRYIRAHGDLKLDPSGNTVKLYGAAQDITEAKIAERTLLQSEKRLREAEKIAKLGDWSWQVGSDRVEWSKQVYDIFKAPRKKPSYAFARSFVHPDDLRKWERTVQRAVANQEPFQIDYRAIRSDEATIWVHNETQTVFDAKGNFTGFRGTVQDITERKQTELALKESEKRYRAVVDSQSEVISRVKTDGTFTFVNDAYCRFFGKSESDLIGEKWFPVAHADDLPEINRRLKELSVENPEVVIENRVWDTKGRVRWMQFINHGFFDDQGDLYEIQSVGRDNTELKEKEQLIKLREMEIREKAEDLKKTNNALEVLLEHRNRQLDALKEDIYRNYSKLILPELNNLKNRLKLTSNRKKIELILNLFESMVSADTARLTSGRYGLTKTEVRIAAMVLNDMTSSEIANHLSISINTVGFHRKNLRKKLGLNKSNIELSQYLKQHLKNPQ